VSVRVRMIIVYHAQVSSKQIDPHADAATSVAPQCTLSYDYD